MLPGVECARRRRFHQSSGDSTGGAAAFSSTRRPSFCLYTSNHETSHSSISSLVTLSLSLSLSCSWILIFLCLLGFWRLLLWFCLCFDWIECKFLFLFFFLQKKKQRSISNQAYEDEKLGGLARQAKERLDERLRTQKKSAPNR